ncbi:non-ribosomal peptide synthase/polyketide synthase, partial [Stutzerimonas kirkiae]|uniref:non-ribosomal peptide synthase/polyketide synthase n=1 Tax=Stutzerimonas kirkiae TaxID=2211392 RepID=UPI00103849D8
MNAENAQKLARRFIELPSEKRRLFLEGLCEEGVDFSLFPIPANVACEERDGLSYAQQRMWFLWQLDPQSAAYNLPMAVRLKGELDRAALQHAFDGLVARHETLRSRFSEQDGLARQHIVEPFAVAIAQHDLSAVEASEREDQVRILADDEALAPFDLTRGPLLRVHLLKLAAQEHVLLLTLHHIVADGWSYNVLIDEFIQFYDAASSATEAALQPLPIQYRDYALWQRSWLEAGEQDRQLVYWRDKLGGEHVPLELPTDHPRPLTPSYRGARHEFEVEPVLAERLRILSREQGVTLFMVLLAAFKVLLYRYSGQSAIRVGVPVANRNRAEVEGLIGCFINTQVLHTEIDPLIDVRELLQRVKETALGAQAHQDLPFERLVEALDLDRSLSHSPLFQVLFNHQSHVADTSVIKGQSSLTLAALQRESRIAQFDLTLDTYEQGGHLYAAFGYATDLFDEPTIERMAGHWRNLLEGIVQYPQRSISELPLLSSEEHRQIVYHWNRTEANYPRDQCIHALIEEQAAKTPDSIAVLFGDQELTYRQLNQRANQLARKLRELGVGPEVLVGIAVERSLEIVIGLLAILKTGGAYVPLDPEYPQQRLAYMLEDSQALLLLSQSSLLPRLPQDTSADILLLDQLKLESYSSENTAATVTPEGLAYSIYTSGSTGRPKGVLIEHRNVAALIGWAHTVYSRESFQGVLASTSICFDLSVWELFVTLAAGGYVVLANNALELPLLAAKERVHLINTVPSAIKTLYETGQLPETVHTINLAGEPLKQSLVDDLYRSAHVQKVYDLYGPSEDTTYSTYTLREKDGQANIGRPISNSAVYLIDESVHPVPIGSAGELCLSGAGLTRGYLRRPALTAEKFLPNPFDESEQGGGRLYRTGDLARYRPDGVIEYVGRIDHQVKVRGFRIELGEIEAKLQEHAAVREAVVIDIDGPGGKQLAAYLVLATGQSAEPDQQNILLITLREHLKAVLPDYMVPTHLLFLDALPLTPNGKLDRKALPKPDTNLLQKAYVAPHSELEQHIADIWADVLGIERVGLSDNFFALGGHSLLATRVISRIRQTLDIELPLRSLFEAVDLSGFVAQAGKNKRSKRSAFEKADRSQPLALSYAQQRQWFLWQLEPQGAAYNIPAALRLKGTLDIGALHHGFESLIVRHETLRTTFRQEGDQAIQIIHPSIAFALEVETVSQASEENILVWVEAEANQPFDLVQGPLLRVRLLRLAESDHVLLLTLHHIVSDGWSMPVMVDELVQLYEGYSTGREVKLPELPAQYTDYAIWQRQWMAAGEQERQLAYWKAQLGDEQPVLELPTDHPRPAMQSYSGSSLNIGLDSDQVRSLRQLAQQQGVTLFMLLLASFQTLLHRYSGQCDIRVGVPIANRTRAETERLIGFFVNTQVLKAEFDLGTTFRELLQQVKHTALEAQAHQDLPFEKLVEALQPQRSLSHSPLFQVMFNHQAQVRGEGHTLPGLKVESLVWDRHAAQFDLTLDTFESEGGLRAALTYATDLFEHDTVERLAAHWKNLLSAIIQNPQQRISELPLLSEEEYQRTVHGWNSTRASYPSDRCIHQLIEAQSEKTPHSVAVIFGDQELTYQQLNQRSNQLAHKLGELGVGPDVLVGIAVERSPEMVVGLLAILKAGGAYVPLDPEYPQERLNYMLEDSGAILLLSQSALQARLPLETRASTLMLDQLSLEGYPSDNPVCLASPENLAYSIYTSGSTGRPKGVLIEHRNAAALIGWARMLYSREELQGVLASTSICFDLSVWELFVTLSAGGYVVLASNALELPLLVAKERVRLVNTVPSVIQALCEAGQLPDTVRTINLAGEALKQSLVDELYRAGHVQQVYDLYGPSEDTTYSTCTLRVENGRANIGRPISNGTAYLLDGSGLPVAIGCVAELCLAGAGLARGYLGRPALTAEKFLPNPYDGSEEGGGRLYRTGDLARYRADGVIEYAGRIDHQVKVRGFRIELGEVEARLLEQEAVLEAVVLAQEALGGQQLVGHIVPSAGEVLEDLDAQSTLRDRIKEQLKASLPDYMVPAYLLFLREMPLTPNGKLDRKALPMPDISLLQQKYVAPRSELQQSIAAIWAEVLKVEQVGLTDNFFELGGDSIISIQVVSRARQAGISFTAKDLFQRQTVLELAVVARMFVGQQIDQGPVTGEMPLTPIQRSFFEVEVPERYHWNQSVLLKPAERLVPERLGAALNVLVEHHDALRLRFTEKERNWTARFEGKSDGELLWQRDLSDIGGLEVLCNEAQASLSLEQGPLLRALLVNLPKGQQRLLLVIHHLVVDGISWRIVLEDLQTAYQQLSQGRGPELPSKTSSLQTWAEHLIALAASPMLEQELAYWQNQLQDCSDDLPCDHPDGGRQYRHAVAVSSHLDRDWTRRLLQDAPAAYRTQVNDLLLTALARVICHWTGQPSALIRLEGHGREDLFEGLDTTRTLGWFTSMYPLRLALARDEASSLKTVKEQLRAVPNKGLGYGLLRHLGKETVRQALQRLPRGEIVFNYLGQFDQSFDVRAGLFMPADESGGRSQSGEAPLDGLLSINGQVYGGELSLGWTFSREVFDEETVQRLADEYTEELKALIEHCTAQGSAGLTPSDFPLAGLDQAQLDALPISARDIEDIYPLSPMQQGMLFHTLYAQGGGDYINQMRVDVDGLDVERFRQAWQSVVDRHDVLRARFVTQFEQPLQVIRRQVEIPFASLDWSAQLDIQQSLDTWAEADRQQGFDLLNDPLLRLAVIRTGENSHHLIYTSHHILMDGWSSSQLLGEVLQVYAGQPGTRQPSRYRDYIDWLQKQDKASSEAFWKEQLKDLDGPTRLAQAIRQDKVDLGTGYGDHYQVLDQQQTQRLIDFARQQRVTVNTLVQAAWLLLLQRYTGQDSVTFGATVAGRPGELQGVEQQLGLFINTLSVIASPKQEQSVAQWIEQVQAQNLALREHEHTPLYEIQRWAGFGGESLFDNILVFENYPISEALQQGAPDGLSFSAVVNHEQTNYPLTLGIGLGEELSIHYSYDREHFSAESVARLGQHFGKLLDAITQQPQQALGELRLLDEQEYQRIVHEWNRTQADYPSDRCIHELIEDQVRRTPQAVAVVFEDLQLTYEQLDKKANRLAYKLIELGVCTDVLVGIAVERSPEMVIGLLAILKAGGAYVPLDPEYPRERLAYMIEDSGIGLLLIQEHLREHLPVPESVRCLGLDQAADWLEGYGEDDPARQSTCDSAAYVIFTSGSTGKPKGVTIPHGAFAMHCQAAAQRYGITGKDCMLQFASISFDAAAEQIFMSLAFGLRLVMGEVKQWSAEQLLERIKEHGVSILNVPPAYLAQVVESQDRAQIIDVRLCILGGEAWGQGVLTGAIRAPHLFNAYGPTEAVVTPMLWEADSEVFDGYAPIGRPVGRRCAYVLDEGLSPLPLSVSGELHLGGEGLGRGYHERPALTAERFIPDPFDSSEQGGGRLYRTGDLTRYRTGGVIEYAGRIDHQVKIRGFRIELGEIEAQLQAHEAVREAVVIDIEEAIGKQLAAYLVTDTDLSNDPDWQATLRSTLRDYLKESLPDYMVPAHLVFLEAMPLTPNGKLDRKALPKPDASQLQQEYVAPRSELEQRIASIWAEVLKVEQVGLSDNFFELGGHSLLATQVISRLRQALDIELPLRTLFETRDLADFARQVGQGKAVQVPALVRMDRSQPLVLSYAQQRQWFLWQLEPESSAYHLPTVVSLKGALDIEALQRSFESLIQRHESLRTTFRQEGEQAIQVVHPRMAFTLAQERLEAADEVLIRTKVEAEVDRPFDLEPGPLLRVKLLRLSEDEHMLILTLHHIVSDGWSSPIMVDELVRFYEGYSQGREVELPELPIQYADYAIWQRSWMEAGEQERQLAYWKAQLGDEQPVLELPTDRTRPAILSQEGAGLSIELNNELAQSLKQLAQQQGVTLFMLLLASFQTLLHRYSGQNDIRVGVPIANRNCVETERLIGFFVNTQVLKAEFELQMSFSELLRQVKRTALEAQAHQDLPFEQLVEALQPERSLSHSPLFQVMYNHQAQVKGGSRVLPGLKLASLEWSSHTSHFDLTLDTFEHEAGIGASLNYATALFDEQTIARLARHWLNLLQGIVKTPSQRIAELPMLAEVERRAILEQWDNTHAIYPGNRYVHQLIEEQVRQTPNAVAVIFNDQPLTYRELDAQANRLAHKLIEMGVGPEVRVAIAMRRSAEIMVAFLAVLKAGGAYVPLDVAHPRERLLYMMEDCKATLVLTQSDLLDVLAIPQGLAAVLVDKGDAWSGYPNSAPVVAIAEDNLAYVIYTSGSTGQPKGVAVSHGPLVAHIQAIADLYETGPADCELHFMSFAFDGSHEGWMPALAKGARVLIRDDSLWLPEYTYAQMHQHNVTIGIFPPVYLQQLAEHAAREGNPPTTRIYCFGGDAVPQASYELARKALRPDYIVNGYGPTETVVTPLLWKAGKSEHCGAAYAPIGRLVGRRRGYVLGSDLSLLPAGFTGELYLGGHGVARGYLDRPGFTAERFVPDPFGDGERVYRSGDLTRTRADGIVDYLGRIDYQVKIRGFRIELGEIEARLQDHEAVRESVVIDIEGPSGKQLAAYLVTDTDLSNDREQQATLRTVLRDYLKESLPDYMVPAHLVFLDKLPLTPNGKLDRKALPEPDASQLQQEYVAPQSELEQRIAAIWADVLKVERVGLTDNFFELGGDSIISIQVVSRARQMGIGFTPKELFQHQTVQGLASVAKRGEEGGLRIDQGPVTGEAL